MDELKLNFCNSTIFKKIFFFSNSLKWSGGWSRGKKVFWGRVGSCSKTKLRFFTLNNYSVVNSTGLIQTFFFSKFYWHLYSIIFYPDLGLLTLNQKESTQKIGSKVVTTFLPKTTFLSNGLSSSLLHTPVGSVIHLIQSNNKNKISFVKSPGCYSKILQKSDYFSLVQLPSKIYYLLPNLLICTIGLVSSFKHKFFYKAGQKRWEGIIPKVRGVAMNPVDHPHGGRTNGGKHPWTPAGFLTRGVKTRKPKKWSKHRFVRFLQ